MLPLSFLSFSVSQPFRSLTYCKQHPPKKGGLLAFRKQQLSSHFPHPAPITVIINTVSQRVPTTAAPDPTVPSFCCPEGCAAVDGSSGPSRWMETEGDSGRKRKLFNTLTGKKRSEGGGGGGGGRRCYCHFLLTFSGVMHNMDEVH